MNTRPSEPSWAYPHTISSLLSTIPATIPESDVPGNMSSFESEPVWQRLAKMDFFYFITQLFVITRTRQSKVRRDIFRNERRALGHCLLMYAYSQYSLPDAVLNVERSNHDAVFSQDIHRVIFPCEPHSRQVVVSFIYAYSPALF